MLKMRHTTSENENNYLSTQGQLNKESLSERYDGKTPFFSVLTPLLSFHTDPAVAFNSHCEWFLSRCIPASHYQKRRDQHLLLSMWHRWPIINNAKTEMDYQTANLLFGGHFWPIDFYIKNCEKLFWMFLEMHHFINSLRPPIMLRNMSSNEITIADNEINFFESLTD